MFRLPRWLIKSLILLAFCSNAHAIEAFRPVPEWTKPKAVVMALDRCDSGTDYQKKRLSGYLELLRSISQVIHVRLWTSSDCSLVLKDIVANVDIELEIARVGSPWIRDYAPIWLRSQSEGAQFSLTSFSYKNMGSGQFEKNLPSRISNERGLHLISSPTFFEGGNLQVDDDGNCFTAIDPFTFNHDDEISESSKRERRIALEGIGCSNVIALEALPWATRHSDMLLRLLPNKVALMPIFSQVDADAVMKRNYEKLVSLGYRIEQVPTQNEQSPYVNLLIVGRHAFVPRYGDEDADSKAAAVIERLGYVVHTAEMSSFALYGGSIHCLTNVTYE